VCSDLHTGVELGEWLEPAQTKRFAQLDEYESEVVGAAHEQGLTRFRKSFADSNVRRYAALVTVKSLPPRAKRSRVTSCLVDFLASAAPPSGDHEHINRSKFGQGELPEPLRPFFHSATIWVARHRFNPGIKLNHGASADAPAVLNALEKLLEKKLVKKGNLYRRAQESEGLAELWLVVHYGRGFAINSPFESLAETPSQSLQQIVDSAHNLICRAKGQPFDRIVMFWDLVPRAFCFELWPQATTVSDAFK
jgi:hypothetical protein